LVSVGGLLFIDHKYTWLKSLFTIPIVTNRLHLLEIFYRL